MTPLDPATGVSTSAGIDPGVGAPARSGASASSAGQVDTLEERIRTLEEQLRRLQDERVQRDQPARRPRPLLGQLLSAEVRAHLRAAQRERLLALRALLDTAIKRTEEAPARERERPRRPESVRID